MMLCGSSSAIVSLRPLCFSCLHLIGEATMQDAFFILRACHGDNQECESPRHERVLSEREWLHEWKREQSSDSAARSGGRLRYLPRDTKLIDSSQNLHATRVCSGCLSAAHLRFESCESKHERHSREGPCREEGGAILAESFAPLRARAFSSGIFRPGRRCFEG